MQQTPSLAAVRQAVAEATSRARRGFDEVVAAHRRANDTAAAVAADADLRLDARSRRQAAARAAAGQTAYAHLVDAHRTLHRITSEARKRALPTAPSDPGQAIKQRAEIEQFFMLEEHKQGELLRTDQQMREALFGGGTRFDLERAQRIPTIDFSQIQTQAMQESAPLLMDSISAAEQAARTTLKAASRVVAAGMTGANVDIGGLHPAQQTGDIATRYQQLPGDWNPDQDGVAIADQKLLAARAQLPTDQQGVA
jgi:hypothetical protein